MRFCIVKFVEYQDFNTLTECFRHSWLSLFGPPQRIRCDSESAFAHDAFAVLLESLGIERELVLAKDSHTLLSPLDRKVKILRLAAPRIISTLSEDNITISPEDLASELQYCVNCQLTYGGMTPYACLFGTAPRELWSDETDFVSNDEGGLPFWEMAHVRHRAIAAFHQALLRFRLERSLKARPRTDLAQNYTIGQLIDVYIKNSRKDLEGWRGPGTLLAFSGEGRATIRWQSSVRDVPFNLLRPHLAILNSSALPKIASAAISDAAPAVEPPVNVVEHEPASSSAHFVGIAPTLFALVEARNNFEVMMGTDSADQLRSPYFDTLVSLASSLELGAQQIHALDTSNQGKSEFSHEASRDLHVIYSVGAKFAKTNHIDHYAGVILQSGRRLVQPLPGIRKCHTFVWTHPDFIHMSESHGQTKIDWVDTGVCTVSEVHLLRAIVFLEARHEQPTLTELLNKIKLRDQQDNLTGNSVNPRLRNEEWPFEDQLVEDSPNSDDDDIGPSVSERDDSERIENAPASSHEIFIASTRKSQMRDHSRLKSVKAFPVDRKTRPLTPHELHSNAIEVEQACLKELQSWIDNNTGVPTLRTDYCAKTGLRPLPSRWVIEFKEKLGKLVIKARLCLKGFAEANQFKLSTASPTASRVAHRLIYFWVVQNRWTIESLDVSTAFLQGWTFAELREAGFERQACAFVPPDDVWPMLVKLDPSTYTEAFKNQHAWVIELLKAAYGLKDAPLLWNLRVISFLLSLGLQRSHHDGCLLFSVSNGSIDLMLSLHVDDTLVTGLAERINWLHCQLELKFGKVKREQSCFKHMGVDVIWSQNAETKDVQVVASQESYIANLRPITVTAKRRAATTPATASEITEYRSLVSGIAWVGVTSCAALAAASMLQNALPLPTVADLLAVNCFLQQLITEYRPLIFKYIAPPLRLLEISDSSLGNVAKYSQNGHQILICSDSAENLCGSCVFISYRSNKSKRVASSTMHAEALAATAGIEECLFLQTWLLELERPTLSIWELLDAPASMVTPIVACMDCEDLYATFVSPATPAPTNRALTLYLAALREQKELGRVKAWCWVDTKDMLANALTKLEANGTLPLDDITDSLARGFWEPKFVYKWQGQLTSAASTFATKPKYEYV